MSRTFELRGTVREDSGQQRSDEEVATLVRMLCRSDLDHEIVCVMGRDRILSLSQQCRRLEACENDRMMNVADLLLWHELHPGIDSEMWVWSEQGLDCIQNGLLCSTRY